MNEHAQALGKRGRGKKKTMSHNAREQRRAALRSARLKRWPTLTPGAVQEQLQGIQPCLDMVQK